MAHHQTKPHRPDWVRYRPREFRLHVRLLPGYRPSRSKLDWNAIPPAEERSRMEHWHYDHGPRVAGNQAIASQSLGLITTRGREAVAHERGYAEQLPGLLDQFYAGSEHVWYRWHARHVTSHHARAFQSGHRVSSLRHRGRAPTMVRAGGGVRRRTDRPQASRMARSGAALGQASAVWQPVHRHD